METIIPAAAAFFKHKAVTSIIALVCWPAADQHRLVSGLWSHGCTAITSCGDRASDVLNVSYPNEMLGVLYFAGGDDQTIHKVQRFHFSTKFKWLIVGEHTPAALSTARYESDITLMRFEDYLHRNDTNNDVTTIPLPKDQLLLYDIYVHPFEGASTHPWGLWTSNNGLRVQYENERTQRRYDFKGHIFKIASPMGLFDQSTFAGDFRDYLLDERTPELESATKCGYAFAVQLFEPLNLTAELIRTTLWSSHAPGSSSMARMVSEGEAQVSGSVLRILTERLDRFEFISAIWPFRLGFTYVAARESDTNMFAAPFSTGVWWVTSATAVVLSLALLLAARGRRETEGAVYSAIATCLQQDASAVPEGASGRGVFLVLSVCSMLLHSYYTSAVVSSLLDGSRGGPRSIRELADSNLKAAAEDYEYVRHILFDVVTTWDDLEYFKKKKKTASFYQTLQRGVELIGSGSTAFHAEFNGIYPHLVKSLPDSDLCRLRHVDTVPEVTTYVVASKNSEYSNTMKAKSQWLHETGIASRIVSKWRMPPPACRASVLAERVKLEDVMPLVVVMVLGPVAAIFVLLLEIAVNRSVERRVVVAAISVGRVLEI